MKIAPGGNPAILDGVCLQSDQHIGFMSMVDSIMARALVHLARLDARRRLPVPASELVVGVQCGGSDALSGVTANPAVGFASDLLVRAAATVLFSETTEVRDAIDRLTARASSPLVAQALLREMAWSDLAAGYGHLGNSNHPEVQLAIAAVLADAKACGKPDGILAPAEAAARRYLEMGATFVAVGSDLGLLRSGTQALRDRYQV